MVIGAARLSSKVAAVGFWLWGAGRRCRSGSVAAGAGCLSYMVWAVIGGGWLLSILYSSKVSRAAGGGGVLAGGQGGPLSSSRRASPHHTTGKPSRFGRPPPGRLTILYSSKVGRGAGRL